MHIQEVFNAMYQKHHYEYIVIDKDLHIIEFSDKVIAYCDAKLLRTEDADIYSVVPELYGLEKEIQEVYMESRKFIEIPFIKKNDLYVTLSVQAGRTNGSDTIETLIVLFENVTKDVEMERRSVQDRNDKELLMLEISEKNKELEKYNLHMQKLVKKEVLKNDLLNKEIIHTQREVIATMGAIGETRSKETGDHVLRVAEYSYMLALKAGLNVNDADDLKMASPMHDIGKVGIQDSILNKPARLTEDEFEIMKKHAQLGYEMLKGSSQRLLQTAATVAYEHHEKWDGTGYPRGLKGNDIHIYGRIIAIADVFDALGHDRVYKKAWPLEDILLLLKREKGKHFDPILVDLFIANIDDFLEIKNKFI